MAAFSSLPSWARQVLAGAGLFVLGGLITFGYSWRPLHGALTWEVAALEKRLDERNLENLKLSDEIARLRSQAGETVDRAELERLEGAFARSESALAQAQKDLARADRERRTAGADAKRWRERFEALRQEQSESLPAGVADVADPGPD